MVKRRIMYLIILAVSFWIMLMYNGVLMEGIFVVAVLLPVILIILMYIAKSSIYVKWMSSTIKTEESKPIKITAVISNHFFLPANRVELTFEIEDSLGNKEECKMVTNLMSYTERYCTMEFCPNYSGYILVRLKRIKINDVLGLTCTKKKIGSVLRIMVMPKNLEDMFVTVENNMQYKEEGDEYADNIPGYDKSQIFDMNRYQTGDNIKDIHWKLSIKTDELIVKRYSFPIENQVNVFIDYGKPANKKITAAGVDRFYRRLFSLLNELEKDNDHINIYAFTGSDNGCIKLNKDDILYLDINDSSFVNTVCENFGSCIGTGSNILISSRITKEMLADYISLSDYYIDWDDLYSDKDNTIEELVIQEAKIIGINMETPDEKDKPLAAFGEELYINKDNEDVEIYTYIVRMLFVLFGSISPALIFYDVLVVYNSTPFKVIMYPLAAVAIMFISVFIKKKVIKIIYLAAAFIGILFLIGIKNIINGAVQTVMAFGKSMVYHETSYGLTESGSYEISCFVALIAFVFAVLLFAFTWNSVTVIIHMIITIPFIALCFAYGCVPSGVCTVMYVVYISGLLAYSITYKNIVKAEERVRKKAFYESTINIGAVLSYAVMCVAFAIMMINVLKGYHRPGFLVDLKSEINMMMENFGLEDNDGNSNIATGGANKGKLGTVDKVKYSGKTVLNVEVTGELNFPLYLRGYIGSEYTGSSWDVPDDDKNAEMSEKMTQRQLLFHEVYNLPYYIMSEKKNDTQSLGVVNFYRGRVKIENMYENDLTYYIPYGAYVPPDIVLSKDGVIINNAYGPKTYEVYQLQGMENLQKYMEAAYESGYTKYCKKEENYEKIVYEYYSKYDGSETAGERLKNEMPWEYTIDGITYNLYDGPENIGYEPYIKAVCNYLDKNYEYTLSPGKLENGRDFLEQFMERKKGYCTYFATIATEMFRIYGIPARYVEGYYVKPQAAELIDYYKNNTITVEVKDDNAHAWTEIYIDGLGFIPIETTPGYTGINYKYRDNTENEPATTGNSGNNGNVNKNPNETTTANAEQKTTLAEKADKDTDEKEADEGADLFGFMKNKYIATLLAVVAIVTVILGRKSHYDRKNDEVIRQKNRADEADMWEKQLMEMARSIKPVLMFKKNGTREQMADTIVTYLDRSNEKTIDRKELENMFYIFDKAVYSEEGVRRKEMNKAAGVAEAVLKGLYKDQKCIRKLFIKYIKCLYLK